MKNKYRKLLEKVKDKFLDIKEPGGGKSYRYYHALRTFKYCKKFLELEELKGKEIDKDALLIAAILHDIGCVDEIDENDVLKSPEDEKKQDDYNKKHEEKSALYVSNNIEEIGKEKRKKIASIVGNHHQENPDNIETKILQDADNLDELGALTIWRYFTYAGFKEHSLEEGLKYWEEEGKENLEEVLKRFNFEKTKEMANKRIEKTKNFMEELKREHQGKDLL